MPAEWKVTPPKNDDEYFEQMSRALFQAGLNWTMIKNKWPNFQKAFGKFSIGKVAKFTDSDVKILMKNEGIVRNERKILSVIANAQECLRVKKDFGSFRNYINSFGGDHDKLADDLKSRFRHLGDSSTRMFLYMSGIKLKPTKEEMQWHA